MLALLLSPPLAALRFGALMLKTQPDIPFPNSVILEAGVNGEMGVGERKEKLEER